MSTRKPKLLDLFCGAGGSAMGYHRAGFEVVGVDIAPQPRYPFPFILGDALDVLARMIRGEKFLASDGRWYGLDDFAAIHASPPCQGHSALRHVTSKDYPDLIPDTRKLLIASGKPYIIENVERAPLIDPIILCGTWFDLRVFRHRKFETSFFMMQPPHIPHSQIGAHVGRCGHRDIDPSGYMSIAGHFSNIDHARAAMGIDWMTQGGLAQAIPPAYTTYIGRQMLDALGVQGGL